MSKDDSERVNEARRRLLRVGAYVAPAVLSVVVVRNAQAQQNSCGPFTMGMGAVVMATGMPATMGDMGNADMMP